MDEEPEVAFGEHAQPDGRIEEAAEPEPVAQLADEAAETDAPATAVPPFLRPVFAEPQDGWINMTSQDEPEDHEAEAAFMQRHGIAAPYAGTEAEAEGPAGEPVDAQNLDVADFERLRSDMLAEIEGLRAEVASLRAVQAHTPFAAPAAPEIDPEALKDCFTLIEERLSALEFRAEEQDGALRRVLTLLVDWVEREEQLADVQAVA
jgi:hypothetical protein